MTLKKLFILFLVFSSFLVMFSLLVNAEVGYVWMCLRDGQSIPSAQTPYYTCDLKLSDCCCEVCARAGDLDPRGVHPTLCDDRTCNYVNGTFDENPPNITINNPISQSIHTSSSILMDVTTSEPSKLERYDFTKRKWVTICSLCSHYSRERRFDDGEQILRIRATDRGGNGNENEVSFFVDSNDPRMGSTNPTRGYASGLFEVEFTEDNPDILTLYYGNLQTGMRDVQLDTNNDCLKDRKTACSKNVNLDDYSGQEIEYWFELVDIAGNSAESKKVILDVDSTFPIINNPNSMHTIDGKYVYFEIDVTELNLDEVGYIDNLDPKGRERRLCSKLDNGICEKKITFKDGPHDVTVYVIDEAGNQVGETVQFFTDSKKPKISKTEPRRGFVDGHFEVQFKEDNPKTVKVSYENDLTGYNDLELNIEDDCNKNRGKYYCTANVNLEDYDAQEIEYWFEVTDLLDQRDESKKVTVEVDTTFPVINNPGSMYTIDGRYVYFSIDITELNIDEVTYIDWSSSRPKERRLCSKLNNGLCEAKKSFSYGTHDLTIQVIDEAANSVGEFISFTI